MENLEPFVDLRPLPGKPFGAALGRVGYYEHEIDNWIRTRLRARSGRPAAEARPMPDNPRILTEREVQHRTGLSKVTRQKLEKAGKFPQRVRIT